MKLKVKDWKGLYTNVDENDQSLELARTSINFKHNRGFLEFESRNLSEYTMPEIDATLDYNWKWETGIYTTITNDPLKQDGIAVKYDCLILVAKAEDSGTYHRLVYLKDLTNNSAWYELSKNGNANPLIKILNHDGAGGFSDSYFSTTKDGQAYFREESGHVKLFLPHTALWIGRLERKVSIPAHGIVDYDTLYPGATKWYIDKLVDSFDPNLNLEDAGATCPYPHRLYWKGGITTSTDNVTRNREVNMGSSTPMTDQIIEDGHGERTTIYRYNGRFKENAEPIPTTVEPYAPSVSSSLVNTFYGYAAFGAQDTHMVFSTDFYTYYEPYDPVTDLARDLVSEGIAGLETDTLIWINGSILPYILTGRASHIIALADFDNIEWRYKGTESTADNGFESAIEEFNMIVTAVLDEREEVIVKYVNKPVNESAPWKIVFISAGLLNDSNARVTRLRYYLKLQGETVYKLYKDIEYLRETDEWTDENTNFSIIEADNTGITLAQNIGIEPDEESWYTYTVIEGFRDFITESGVSIGISNEDYSNVYYSVLGGGNLQPDLMYKQNILQVAGANVVNAVAVVNKELAVLTDDTTYIIRVIDDVGALVFTIQQALEFGVKNQFDIAQIQGGIAINTRHGIYTTTGTQSNLISEAIDDIIKDNFETSRIYYNKDLHELYYKINASEDLYRFRFKDQVWEMINKTTVLTDVEPSIVEVD